MSARHHAQIPLLDLEDSQTRFGWPVPTFSVTKRTIVLKIVSVPSMNVTVNPVDDLNNPSIRKMTGMA